MFVSKRTKHSFLNDNLPDIVRKLAIPIILITSFWITAILFCQHTPPLLTTDVYLEQQARLQRLQLAATGAYEYRPPSLPSSIQALEHTRTRSIFIAALVHNNAKFLRTTLKLVDMIGRMFKTYHVGFYENNSTDGTVEILTKWMKGHNNAANIHILSEVLDVKQAISFGGISEKRFSLMATYRNKYISMFEKYAPDVDYVMMLDMDIFDTTLDAVLSSFTPTALAKNWAAVGANGIYDGKRYYDTLAFRNAVFSDTRIRRQRYDAHVVYPPDSQWVSVDSMFGGMAIYKTECMRGCKYMEDGDCEHVSFYKCMSQKSEDCKRFFINPAFIVDYQNFQLFLD